MIVKFEGKEYPFNGYVYPLNSINELVNDAYNKGRAEALQPIQKLLDDWFCDRADDPNWVLSQISICIFEQTKEQNK